MQRYLWQTALAAIVLFGAVWIYVAALPMAFLDDEYPRWTAKQAMLNDCGLGDLVVVGDSRAAVDIMPEALPVRATNLALAGSSTVEAYVTVKRLLRCPALPKVVVLSISPSHFAGPDTFWRKSARYRFLGRDDLEELRRMSAQIGDWSMFSLDAPDDLPPAIRIWLYTSDFPSIYFNSLVQNGVFLHYARNWGIFDAVTESRGQYFFHQSLRGSDGVAPEAALGAFSVLPILDAYMDRTLALLAARDVRTVFVPMPVNDATYAAVPADFRRAFAAYLQGYAARYANFTVAADVMPHVPNRLVGDYLSHLNRHGAALFNRGFAPCAAALVAGGGLAEACGSTPILQ